MAEHIVVVVGSNQSFPEYTPGNFWVIDFSDAPTSAPTVVSVPCPSSGVVVDCSDSLVAVASVTGGSVTIYDISNPAAPRETGSASLPFNNISAISFYGGSVLVGEASANSGAQVALIDISNLTSPQVLSNKLRPNLGRHALWRVRGHLRACHLFQRLSGRQDQRFSPPGHEGTDRCQRLDGVRHSVHVRL